MMIPVANDRAIRLVGAASVPRGYLRVAASWPLAVLTVEGSRLTLRVRWFGRLAGADELDVMPDQLARAYPIGRKARKSGRARRVTGVGFTDLHGHDFYFYTGRAAQVLGLLRDHGYPVSTLIEKATKVWRGVP